MEVIAGLAILIGLAALAWRLLARTGPTEDEELAGLVAGNWPRLGEELEDGSLDPDELEDEPLAWDEGADDELD